MNTHGAREVYAVVHFANDNQIANSDHELFAILTLHLGRTDLWIEFNKDASDRIDISMEFFNRPDGDPHHDC